MPTRRAARDRPGVKMPLSPTTMRSAGTQRRQPLAGGKRGLEGPQIAVVDADQPRFQAKRALQFVLVMDFDQHVHAEREGRIFELCGAAHRRAPP